MRSMLLFFAIVISGAFLRADFGLWLDHPNGRSNPYDPKFDGSKGGAIPPTLTPSPSPTVTPTPCKGLAQSFSVSYGPDDLDVDPSGNVYAAEATNNQVRRYSSSGLTLTAVDFSSVSYTVHSPRRIKVRANGNVVASGGSYPLSEATSTGTFVANYAAPFLYSDFDFFPNGDIAFFIWPSQFRRVSSSMAPIWSGGSQGSGPGQIQDNGDLAVDAAGDLYVADGRGGRVHKYSGAGVLIWTANFPSALTTLRAGEDGLIYAGAGSAGVYAFDTAGNIMCRLKSSGTGADAFPVSDNLGNVYLVPVGTNSFQKYQ